jgi:hypothetical protein
MTQAAPSRPMALAGAPEGAEGAHEALAPGLAQLVVGSVTLLVTGLLEGHPPPPGVSVEVSPPWPRLDHRRWLAHPLCPGHPREPGHPGQPGGAGAAGGAEESLRRGA